MLQMRRRRAGISVRATFFLRTGFYSVAWAGSLRAYINPSLWVPLNPLRSFLRLRALQREERGRRGGGYTSRERLFDRAATRIAAGHGRARLRCHRDRADRELRSRRGRRLHREEYAPRRHVAEHQQERRGWDIGSPSDTSRWFLGQAANRLRSPKC